VVGRELRHPDTHETWVTVERLQQGLCGGSRPHFFRGVATVSVAGARESGREKDVFTPTPHQGGMSCPGCGVLRRMMSDALQP
jgi:hypothetical protein